MPVSFTWKNPLGFLFAADKREQHLERYVLREHRRGRPFVEIVGDLYVRNRATAAERVRLLERATVLGADARDARSRTDE